MFSLSYFLLSKLEPGSRMWNQVFKSWEKKKKKKTHPPIVTGSQRVLSFTLLFSKLSKVVWGAHVHTSHTWQLFLSRSLSSVLPCVIEAIPTHGEPCARLLCLPSCTGRVLLRCSSIHTEEAARALAPWYIFRSCRSHPQARPSVLHHEWTSVCHHCRTRSLTRTHAHARDML